MPLHCKWCSLRGRSGMVPSLSSQEPKTLLPGSSAPRDATQQVQRTMPNSAIDRLPPSNPSIWKVWAPCKIKMFLWLLHLDRLWCNDRLQRRGWDNGYFCPMCMRSLETSVHLCWECPVALQVWHAGQPGTDVPLWIRPSGAVEQQQRTEYKGL